MGSTDVMSGVVLTGHGGPEVLEWRDDLPRPVAGPGDVVIRVTAAGVNNTDINTRLAWYSKSGADAEDATWTGKPLVFPHIQGIDACGRIVETGEGVDPARIGERVIIEPCFREYGGVALQPPWFFGSECDGAFAQFARVPARHAFPVASALDDVELASFPCSYSTAENMLTRARVASGDRVLVTGASGGVGSAAVQLARARGAEVIAVTSPAKAQDLRELGAALTLDRNADYVAELGMDGVDVVIDLVAGPKWPTLLDVLRREGRYAVSGAIAGPEVTLDVRTLYLKDLSFFGCTVLGDGVFAALVRRIEAGQIKPLLAETFALRDLGKAQEAFERRSHIGKIGIAVAAP